MEINVCHVGTPEKFASKHPLKMKCIMGVYAMSELQKFASKHNIENEVYYGGAIETIYEIIGFKYRNKFIAKYCQIKLIIWDKMIQYL